jgi:hypothetical protein
VDWRHVFADTEVLSTRELLAAMTRKQLRGRVERGELIRVQRGVYAIRPPDAITRLEALDLRTGVHIVACLNTAADLYGFNTEPATRLHILDPGRRLRPTADVMVHQRLGAPLRKVGHRLATTPTWTAVELARSVRRSRALAVLDAALRTRSTTVAELLHVVGEQKGRRGIVHVRDLLQYADARAESPMESETRLVFIDGGLPMPELQYEIVDLQGRLWRADFAWPKAMLVAEYESMEWHATPQALRHDRMKVARLQECGWTTVPLVVDDVRRHPAELVARISGHLLGLAG